VQDLQSRCVKRRPAYMPVVANTKKVPALYTGNNIRPTSLDRRAPLLPHDASRAAGLVIHQSERTQTKRGTRCIEYHVRDTVVALCWSYQPARAKPSPLELPMAKKLQLVRFNEVDPNHVGTISLREIEARVRKALPPPSQLHQSKVKYRRRPKHRGQPVD